MIRRTYLAWLAITVASPARLTLHVSHALPLILESSMGQAISVSAWKATMIRVSQYAMFVITAVSHVRLVLLVKLAMQPTNVTLRQRMLVTVCVRSATMMMAVISYV